MFIKNNIIYSDAGKYLTSDTFVGFKVSGNDTTKYSEKEFGDITISGDILKIGDVITRLPSERTFKELKQKFVRWHYSNDDQIALMLNKDKSADDLYYYNKMQEWREWSGTLTEKVLNTLGGC